MLKTGNQVIKVSGTRCIAGLSLGTGLSPRTVLCPGTGCHKYVLANIWISTSLLNTEMVAVSVQLYRRNENLP